MYICRYNKNCIIQTTQNEQKKINKRYILFNSYTCPYAV